MILVAIQDGDRRSNVISGCREIFRNYNLSSACDGSYCDLINSEINVLQSDVKSLTEIVNILNYELKIICQ